MSNPIEFALVVYIFPLSLFSNTMFYFYRIVNLIIIFIVVLPAMAHEHNHSPNTIKMRDATVPPKRVLASCANFYSKNGFLRGEYIFSDNENRKLSVYFVAKDTLVIYNESVTITNDGLSLDLYLVHFKDKSTIIVDSLIYTLRNDTTSFGELFHDKEHPLKCKKRVAKPGSDASKVNCANEAFYLLGPGDEILCLNYYERLQIKDFQFILKDMLVDDYFKLFDCKDIIPIRENDSNEFYHRTKKEYDVSNKSKE